VHVNIGDPIPLTPLLDRVDSGWRSRVGQGGKFPGVATAVDALSQSIMRGINSAAAMTPVNLLALALLSTPRHVMLETDLIRQIELYRRLLRLQPYAARVTITELDGQGIIATGEKLGMIQRGAGATVQFTARHAASMPYYRNNVLHLLAMPSLLACCFLANARVPAADLQRLAWRIYPYIASELFLRWEEDEVAGVIDAQLAALEQAGLLRRDGDTWLAPAAAAPEAMQLSLLAQSTLQTIERYYLAIALLRRAGSGVLTQAELEKQCQQMAARMLTLYGFDSPEFHDRALFEGFIGLLRRRGVLKADGEGRLLFDEVIDRIADDSQLVLSDQLRHSILQVVHG